MKIKFALKFILEKNNLFGNSQIIEELCKIKIKAIKIKKILKVKKTMRKKIL